MNRNCVFRVEDRSGFTISVFIKYNQIEEKTYFLLGTILCLQEYFLLLFNNLK